LADKEAPLAEGVPHEIGKVTTRRSAPRYSWGVGGLLLRTTDAKKFGKAFDLRGWVFLSSYSKDQESEAYTLGIRYLTRAGYDPKDVQHFLAKLTGAWTGSRQDPN
jgi:predicted Zn-dependent protease